jgi:metallo-beta-lactamase family protein
VVLCESTYGDRDHPSDPSPDQALSELINRVADRGGVLVVPAFAVDRTQMLLYYIRMLEDQQRIPSLPVYIDSPMAISVTEMYLRHHDDHDREFTAEEYVGNPLHADRLHVMRSIEESKQINDVHTPAIIISASGMASGGRVMHHLARRLPDRRNCVVLCGSQAEGTGGRALEEGARYLRIHGQVVPVRSEVVSLHQFSAHADRSELIRWLGGLPKAPKHLFLVHGEPAASAALQSGVERAFGWHAVVPRYGQRVALLP